MFYKQVAGDILGNFLKVGRQSMWKTLILLVFKFTASPAFLCSVCKWQALKTCANNLNMQVPPVTEFTFIVRSKHILQSFSLCEGKPIPACPALGMESVQLPFIPTCATVLSSSCKVILLNVSAGSSNPTQIPVFKHFFIAQLCSGKWHCGVWPSQVFSTCAPRARRFTCVCVPHQNPSDSCLHRERRVLNTWKETPHSLTQAKVTWRWERACPVPP